MQISTILWLALILVFGLAKPGWTAECLFDFSSPAAVATWQVLNPGLLVKPFSGFGTAGDGMLELTVKTNRDSVPGAPALAVETGSPVRDWSKLERLEMDLVNPTTRRVLVGIMISDSQTPLPDGWFDVVSLAPQSGARIVRPMYYFSNGVNRADIQKFHLFLPTATAGDRVLIGKVMLLMPGEKNAEPAPAFKTGLETLWRQKLDALADQLSSMPELQDRTMTPTTSAAQSLQASLRKLASEVAAKRQTDSLAVHSIYDFEAENARIDALIKRHESLVSLLKLSSSAGSVNPFFGVGFASSMQKIKPLALDGPLAVGPGMVCRLARNENESFQVVVLPFGKKLDAVSVKVGDLVSDTGAVLKPEQVRVSVVGFVNLNRALPDARLPDGDWWPDPLLSYLKSVDVEPGILQPFWVRLRTTPEQITGSYRGKITVSSANGGELSFDLTVKVDDFVLPSHAPLPLAVGFLNDRGYTRGPVGDKWEEKKYQYADFLADYWIGYDNIYNLTEPDWDVLMHQHAQGRLVAASLGYYYAKTTPDIHATIERFRPYYEQAKKLGILDHVYVYGFDELETNEYPNLKQTAAAFKQNFPDLFVMTTARDHAYGGTSGAKGIDAWIPATNFYYPKDAADARKNGVKVWWYICCGPRVPWANIFINYPAMDTRLLMGAMAIKFRPDGFLYYSISEWGSNGRVQGGPFLTAWNPATAGEWCGDGCWIYPGPNGLPLASVRLENFRDGLEDYAYACILEATVAKVKADPRLADKAAPWLRQAETALAVPSTLVNTLTQFSHDPNALMQYRTRLSDAIATAPIKPADPWCKGIQVRGVIQ
jgi:hypothetical protein